MSLGSIADVVAGRIGDLLIEEATLLYDVQDEVRNLKEELLVMTSFLQDMDEIGEEGHDERSRTVIKQIRNLAYDAEDLVESYIFEVGDSKRQGFIKRYVCFCGSLLRTYTLASDVKAIKVRIGGTMDRWKKYLGDTGVRTEGRDQREERTRSKARTTYPHNHEDHVVGLEEDINKLVRDLTAGGTQIEVVSIVGMGGSGKTTLARKLYNHESLKTYFDCVAWLSISKERVATDILILQDLLAQVSSQPMTNNEATHSELVRRLQRCLEGKRYLIVLDDVWEKQAFQAIFLALPTTKVCGKIIVTTRKEKLLFDFANLKCFIHELRRLSEAESWELFEKIVGLMHREESSNSTDMALVEALGKKMLKKCEGLPLAVIALAGLLRKKRIEEWEKIAKAVSSRIMEGGSSTVSYGPVKQMLELSYNDLRRELKPCFLYLANFPEDFEIEVKQLFRMWIAEGFITSDKLLEGDTLEDVAQGYLDELIHQYVVEIAKKNYDGMVESIRMHDLVRDLCINKAKEQDFTKILTSKAPDSDARVIESHRLALYTGSYNSFLTKSQPLRSLIYKCRENVNLQLICQNFRLLRVLLLEDIWGCGGSLPTEIGSLIHLRYLRLRIYISELPSSIGNLRNLQILEYHYNEVGIPDVFGKIEGLKHLEFSRAEPIGDKLKLHTLKSLQTLGNIKGGDWMLKELPLLSQTVQKLEIHRIRSQEQLDAAFQCPSIKFDRLHSLRLEWHAYPGEADRDVMLKNLEPIIHCQHLRELCLFGRIEDRLGGRDIQFPNGIKKLRLMVTGLEAEAALEALGKLPSLINLHLDRESYVGTKWTCLAGEFPQLKKLGVMGVPNLEEWNIERGAMPHLNKLYVGYCEKLRKLPEGLKFITGLQKLTLGHQMSAEFMKRVEGGGEDAHIFQHVPVLDLY